MTDTIHIAVTLRHTTMLGQTITRDAARRRLGEIAAQIEAVSRAEMLAYAVDVEIVDPEVERKALAADQEREAS
ncbi:hypothetical protein [Magnetospirillum fulvum]|uniref:Uncharacterized protein n=1 Tax=Magnetospirillum fulvum MGU-K5 TaxID=1316936 RepID=S9TYY5_MAGFU|nr:hypothetical protein [Magnetospirillum fulvum]EPY03525.1 hypothetical protein K678_00400 [Magnetospirillum fulvum MGU-K5]